MPRYKLTVEYIGTHTVGWQRQKEGLSVQAALEAALLALTGETVDVIGAGRTDSGVHATGQVAHVDLAREWDSFKLVQGLNYHLYHQSLLSPCPISVVMAEAVAEDFHARFSATRRYYQYIIANRPARLAVMAGRAWFVPEMLDIQKMQEAANFLLGTHDFSSFRDSQCQSKSPVKTLDSFVIRRDGEFVTADIHAKSFLHHQVRIMMGTLWLAGTDRMPPEEILSILAAKDRAQAGPTAPADGLYLTAVDY